MKKLSIYFLSLFLLPAVAIAQPKSDIRTVETKVADLLMQLPPENSALLDKAMSELASYGTPALTNIAAKLVSPGKGNDVAARFAISGLTKYVGQGADKAKKSATALALAKALKTAKDDEVRDFIMQELHYVAGNESVPILSSYLLSKRLSDPASRVLVTINSAASNAALLNALTKATGQPQLNLVKALGDTRYPAAFKKLSQLAKTANTIETKKVLLRSLALIGNPQSASLLEAEAQKSNFGFNSTDALGSYLLFLDRQVENGTTAGVETAAKKLIANNATNEVVKTAALSLLTKAIGSKAVPELLTAAASSSPKLSGDAIGLLSNFYTPDVSNQLQTIAKKANYSGLQVAVIDLLGKKEDKAALPFLSSFLNTNNQQLLGAAIAAIAKSGKANAISMLIPVLQKGDQGTVAIVKNALQTIAGNEVVDASAKAIANSPDNARIALIELLSDRGAQQYKDLIFEQVGHNNTAVKLAAIKALPHLASVADIGRIATLLNNANTKELVAACQQTLTSVIKKKNNPAEAISDIKSLMQSPGANPVAYYATLAGIGGKEALGIVLNEYKTGNPSQKTAALQALTSWGDQNVLEPLYEISKQSTGDTRNQVLNSFIEGINKSKNPLDQKVLLFRNAMELTTNLAQKKAVLRGISENSSLPALVFVSKYLDDAALQQNAVQAVINIVLDHKELVGKMVEDIAQKAIALNKDAESNYLKEALIRHLATLPKEGGFVPMFNGKDLTGWKGLVENPIARAKMSSTELSEKQKAADEQMRKDWKVENGVLVFEGKGYNNLVSEKMYEDFELFVDWRMEAKGDGGVYLRGSPQVQTWDTSRREVGAQVGSGGLYNNTKNRSTPLLVADNPINEWNTFRIKMIGDKVTVYLNGQLVTDNITLENYWDRKLPIFDKEAIELQAHGTRLEFRDVYVREIPRAKPYSVSEQEKKEGFVPLFNGVNLDGWIGNTVNYYAQEGMIISDPGPKAPAGMNKNIYTQKEYSDFVMRFEFQLTPGANNGLGIRTPTEGDAAYEGMELQILDNEDPIYKDLHNYQYHGSVYGVIPALRGYLKPVGEWNSQEVKAVGNHITITLNGKVILDGDIAKASKNNTATADGKAHPGLLNKTGHIGFLGHGSPLKFRNLRIKNLGTK